MVTFDDKRFKYEEFVELDKICFPKEPVFSENEYNKIDKNDIITIYEEKLIAYGIIKRLENDIYLYRLAVHPDYRRKGYATKIMNYVKEKIGKNKKIELKVVENNKSAVMFYKRNGFNVIGKMVQFEIGYDEINNIKEGKIRSIVINNKDNVYDIHFCLKENNENIGECHFDDDFSGCLGFDLKESNYMKDALFCLRQYMKKKIRLIITTECENVIAACRGKAIKENYVVLKMLYDV